MSSALRTTSTLGTLAVGVVLVAGVLLTAQPAEAATIETHFLNSGLVPVAATGERAELSLVNTSFEARHVKLEIVDAAGDTRAVATLVLAAGASTKVTFDPGKLLGVRGRVLLNRQDGETEILCNAFVATLAIIQTGTAPKTKLLVGDFSHWHP